MVIREQRRSSTIVAIDEVPLDDPAQHSMVTERLACGHAGMTHGATWRGTAAPLARCAEQYQWLIGRRRRCQACTRGATLAVCTL